jgi:hypothetical protein
MNGTSETDRTQLMKGYTETDGVIADNNEGSQKRRRTVDVIDICNFLYSWNTLVGISPNNKKYRRKFQCVVFTPQAIWCSQYDIELSSYRYTCIRITGSRFLLCQTTKHINLCTGFVILFPGGRLCDTDNSWHSKNFLLSIWYQQKRIRYIQCG